MKNLFKENNQQLNKNFILKIKIARLIYNEVFKPN